jgi:peptidoglycan/LPS O-acetylase OafA/YrhL
MSGDQPTTMKALTPLRGLAALAVLSWHAELPVRGYLGVDLFFLLSGFVMMHAYGTMAETASAYLQFLKARLARIYPVHLFVLLLLLPELQTSQAFSLGGLLSSLFLMQSPWHSMCWNFCSWSISAEWHAYLIFPTLARLILVKAVRWMAGALVVCAAIVTINGVIHHSGDITNLPPVLLRCFPEFVAGMILYRLREIGQLPAFFQSNKGFAAALAGLAALEVVHAPDGLTVCLLAVLLISAARDGSAFARFLGWAPFPWLGDISYSLYMVQMVVLVLLQKFAPHLSTWQHSLLFVTGSVLLAAPISRFIEYPARSLVRSWTFRGARPGFAG